MITLVVHLYGHIIREIDGGKHNLSIGEARMYRDRGCLVVELDHRPVEGERFYLAYRDFSSTEDR